jgi:hypothetical protein
MCVADSVASDSNAPFRLDANRLILAGRGQSITDRLAYGVAADSSNWRRRGT